MEAPTISGQPDHAQQHAAREPHGANGHRRRHRADPARAPLPERRPRLAFLFAAVPVLLIGGMVFSAPFLYQVEKAIAPIFDPTPVSLIAGDPDDPEATPVPLPDWDKKERVNILLVGVDKREDEEFSRTDTIILASIDPASKTVGILSIPRDLRVTIPGHGAQKINAAYAIGEVEKLPGGGIKLLQRTIYQNFGVNVHYYASVDFRGFEKIVDTFGGVNVDVPYPIKDDEYPTETLGYTGIYFGVGLQHLDGKTALRYARTRHADGDFGRSRRQQQVILALRQQALSRDLPSKFWQLLDVLGGSVRTDLSVDQAAALTRLGQGIPREDIKTYSLYDLVEGAEIDPDTGVEYVVADMSRVRRRVREMVPNATTAAPTPSASLRIAVQNGAQVPGLAGRAVDRLKRAGFSGAAVDTEAPPEILESSVIYDYGKSGEMAYLVARTLGLPESAVRDGAGGAPNDADIVVVLGQDTPDTPPRAVPTPTPNRRSN